jgi:MSHA biogenesis protein MshJ
LKRDWNNIKTELAGKWNKLSRREHGMVFLAGGALLYTLVNILFLAPVAQNQASLMMEIAQSKSQIQDAQTQLNNYASIPVQDADTLNREKITALKTKIETQNEELYALKGALVSHEEMPGLLKDLLVKNAGVELVAMRTKNAENALSQIIQPQQNTEQAVIYKHGVDLTIAGSYEDLMRYVKTLENMPRHALWESAQLKAQYPRSELTLRLYTLSLDKPWLSL